MSYNCTKCNGKLPSGSKRCTCQENFDEPPRKRLPVPEVFYQYVDKIDLEGRTALHRAAMRGDAGRVKDLLAEGFSPIHLDLYGLTPLLIALNECHESVAKLLIETESGLSIPDKIGSTPLHIAASNGLDEAVKELLLLDVHPYLQDENGQYPVQKALREKYFNVAKIILQMCAWKNISIDFEQMELPQYKKLRCVSVLSECYSEIERMKEAKIEGSNITFYQIATESAGKVAKYLENQNICKILNVPFENFPNYADLLVFKVRKAKVKKVLYDQFVECFTFLSRKWSYLPVTCTDVISLYLREIDMRNVISAVKFFK